MTHSTLLQPGDRVRARRDARHLFDAFRGLEAEVLDLRTFGTPRRLWIHLRFENGRVTWLPATRLEPVEEREGAA